MLRIFKTLLQITVVPFIDLRDEAFEHGGAVPLETEDESWGVDLDLWTAEEGRSDLTLTMTVTETDKGIVIEIDDLHVL